jgi:hypothetical protein
MGTGRCAMGESDRAGREPQIEITAEMLEAGDDFLRHSLYEWNDLGEEAAYSLLRGVFEVMLKIREGSEVR